MTKILKLFLAGAVSFYGNPAWAAVHQEVDVKVQQRTQKTFNGAPSAIPTEYGEIPNGLVLEKYILEMNSEKYMLDIEASNVGYNNQSIRAEGGEPGKMMWKFGWDEMYHLFSNEARSPYVYAGGGTMVLPSGYRSANQTKAAFSGLVRNTPYVGLGYGVDTGNVDLKFHPAHDLTVEVGAMRQTKQGTKGTTGSFGFSNAIELAAPIDWTTYEAYLDLQKANAVYQVGFNYRMSDFTNNIPNLYWDNPLRISDQYASNSGYSTGDQSKNGAQAMDASNKAHSLKVEGGVNLPHNVRVSGEAGYQRWKSHNPMLPYTTNTAIRTTLANGLGTALAFDPSATGPDKDVVGLIEVYTYMGKVAARPFHWLRTSLSHESYIMENKSKQYELPGWAVFDQIWHSETKRTPREQFRDDKTMVGLDYEILPWLSGGTDLKHIYKKQTREIPKIREYEAAQGFTVRPSKDLFVNVSGLMALRRGNGHDLEHYPKTTSAATGIEYFTEHPGMRRIDVADRNRRQGRVQVQWTPGEASLGLSARVTDDKYRAGFGDPTGGRSFIYPDLFGTESEHVQSYGMDFSVPVIGSVVVDGYYEYDWTKRYVRSSQTACAGNAATGYGLPGENACAGAGASPFIMTGDPRSQWKNRTTDRSHIAGVGITVRPVAKLKTFFGYDIVSTLQNADPMYAGSYASTAADPYNPYPSSSRMTQTFRTNGEYEVRKDLTFVANYAYEKFDATDWAYNAMPTRAVDDNSLFLGANPIRNYYAHTVGAGVRYRF